MLYTLIQNLAIILIPFIVGPWVYNNAHRFPWNKGV